MAAFKLTLTKTDTGDVLVDEEIDCLIGAAAIGVDETCKLLFSSCGAIPLAAANAAARSVIKMLETENPLVAALTEVALKADHEKDELQKGNEK